MVKGYIPDHGDVCWASLDPTSGHEQKGRRPVLVLTQKSYNALSGLAVICPITSQTKPYPYVISLGTKGAVLTDQIRSISWEQRKFEYIAKASEEIFVEVMFKIKILLGI